MRRFVRLALLRFVRLVVRRLCVRRLALRRLRRPPTCTSAAGVSFPTNQVILPTSS